MKTKYSGRNNIRCWLSRGKHFGPAIGKEKVTKLSTRNHHMQDSLFKHGSNSHAERTLVGTEEVSNWTRCFKEGKQKFFTIARTKHTTNEDAGKNEKSTREKHTKNAHEERTKVFLRAALYFIGSIKKQKRGPNAVCIFSEHKKKCSRAIDSLGKINKQPNTKNRPTTTSVAAKRTRRVTRGR